MERFTNRFIKDKGPKVWLFGYQTDLVNALLLLLLLLLHFSNDIDVTDDADEVLLAEQDVDVVHQL